MKTTFIYALLDANGVIDYIGKSNNPKKRFKAHGRRGFVLAVAPFLGWKRYETFFISRFLELGGSLRNKNLGGGGSTQHTAETRAKMSGSRKGKLLTPEWRRNIGIGNLGKTLGLKKSPEEVEKTAGKLLGRKHGDSGSGFAGVSWHAGSQKWRARIGLRKGGVYYLGLFKKIEDAVFARALARES